MINSCVAQNQRDAILVFDMIHNQNNQNVAVFATPQLNIKH